MLPRARRTVRPSSLYTLRLADDEDEEPPPPWAAPIIRAQSDCAGEHRQYRHADAGYRAGAAGEFFGGGVGGHRAQFGSVGGTDAGVSAAGGGAAGCIPGRCFSGCAAACQRARAGAHRRRGRGRGGVCAAHRRASGGHRAGGLRGPAAHRGRHRGRQGYRARQQRDPDRRRTGDRAAGAQTPRLDDAGRLGTLRHLPVSAGRARRRPAAHHPDRLGRCFSRLGRVAAVASHRGRRPATPQLEHGPEDHLRLGHAHEQGFGSDRGALPLRRRLRRHRGGGAPAVDRALGGGAAGHQRTGTAGLAGHAPPAPLRHVVAAPSAHGIDAFAELGGGGLADVSRARPPQVSVSGFGVRGWPARWHHAGGAECRQRGGGGDVPERVAAVSGHSAGDRVGDESARHEWLDHRALFRRYRVGGQVGADDGQRSGRLATHPSVNRAYRMCV
eukprot:ctg_1655.g550